MRRSSTHLDVVEDLLEGEGHSTADDESVDLVEHVLDKLDLVRDLGTAEDGKERSLGALENLGKVLELLLHEESGGSLRKLHANHRRVSSVSSAETGVSATQARLGLYLRIVDVDCAEGGQVLPELLDLGRVGCTSAADLTQGLCSPLIFSSPFLPLPSSSTWNRRFSSKKTCPSFPAWTAFLVSSPTQSSRKVTSRLSSSDSLVATGLSEYLELGEPSGRPRCDMRMTDLAPGVSCRSPSVTVRTVVDGVLDGGEGSNDSLSSGVLYRRRNISGELTAGLVILSSLSMLPVSTANVGAVRLDLRDVEVDSNQDSLALELEVGDGELGGERHAGQMCFGLSGCWR